MATPRGVTRRVGAWRWELNDDRMTVGEGFAEVVGIGGEGLPFPASSFFLRVVTDDAPPLFSTLDRVVRCDATLDRVLRLCGPDGSQRWVRLAASRSVDAGVIEGTVEDLHDSVSACIASLQTSGPLARRRRMEEVDGLAGGVAHEFSNILQVVRGYVSFAWQALAEGSEPREDLTQALAAVDRATTITARLRDFAHAEDGATCDVNAVVESTGRLLGPLLGEDVSLRVVTSDESLVVRGGDATLRQCLLNLCLNARDAMPTGGELFVRVEPFCAAPGAAFGSTRVEAGPFARVWVTDTGVGFDPTESERLFSPYYTTKAAGTGLGLAVVRSLIEQNGGAVAAYGEPGVGASFCTLLPLAGKAPERREAPAAVTVVADDPANAQRIAAPLRAAGWRVDIPSTRGASVSVARQVHGVTLTPAREGAARVRRIPQLSASRVVGVTGFDPRSPIGEALAGEFDALVSEPVDPHELARLVRGFPANPSGHQPATTEAATR